MDRELVLAYRKRWEAVVAVEAAEQRSASISTRWRQLNALFSLGRQLCLDSQPADPQLAAVRRRWNTLKDLLA
ncbi:MAG: hypothetical protein RMM07_14115 [Anaerolineae bacterium]|nr:hypothetical protein [Anaerolineae bacterium]MDW8327269.1 hypothetical protein [Anaerolineales bacterium]